MTRLAQIRGHSFLDRLGDSPRVLDLGANDGRFCGEILTRCPKARVVMVEPDPYLVGMIRKRFAEDPRVALIPSLLGPNSMSQAPFHLCKIPEGNSVHRHFTQSWSTETRAIQVEMISLHDLRQKLGWMQIDLVKMDIEGAEWDVLQGIGPEDLAGIAQLSVEFHDFIDPGERARTEACIEHLEALGYTSLCQAGAHQHGSPYFDCLFYRAPAHSE